jgi:hypothetical protein
MNQVDHSFFQERLSAYADRELPADELAVVEDHLLGCAECRRRLDEISKLGELTDRDSLLGESDYWEKAAQKIEAALEPQRTEVLDPAKERPRASYGLWWKLPAIAASLLFLTYIGLHEGDILKEDTAVPSRPVPGAEKPRPESSAVADQPASTLDTTVVPVVETPTGEADYETEPLIADQEAGPREITPSESVSVRGRGEQLLTASDEIAETPPPPVLSRQESVPIPAQSLVEERPAVGEEKAVLPAVTEESAEAPAGAVSTDQVKVSDENYRERRSKKSRAASADSVTLREEIVTPDYMALSDSALQRAADLDRWRTRRDSLLRVTADLARADSVGQGQKPMGVAPSFGADAGTKPLAMVDQQAARKQAKDQAEAALVEAWFQVCRLSQDTVEVRRGVAYLQTVASDNQSASRRQAEEHMKLISLQ